MGRKRSDRTGTPLRRSSRLRNINPVPEDTEKMDKVTPEELPEGDEELSETDAAAEMSNMPSQSHPVSTEGSSARDMLEQSDVASPGYYTVVLNRLKLEDMEDAEKEEQEKKEDGEKDPRKAGRQATSRIPTFQSSSARKRAAGQAVEPVAQPPAKETSSLPIQTRAKGSGSGSSRVAGPGHRETALPLPLARLPISGSDAPAHVTAALLDSAVPSHKRSPSPSPTPIEADDSPQLDPLVLSPRRPIRAEKGPHIPRLVSRAGREDTVQTESVSREEEEEEEEEEQEEPAEPVDVEFVSEEELGIDSSTSPLLEELVQAGESGHKSGAFEEEDAEEAIEPLEDGEEVGETDEGSESEPEFEVKEPGPSVNGAGRQAVRERAEEEEDVDPDVDVQLAKAPLIRQYGTNGGSEGSKSTREELAPGSRSRRRPVLKLEVTEPVVRSYKPPSRSVKKSSASSKSCWRCCPLLFFLSVTLLLVGGGLHLWRYGTPVSVSEVLVQLELGWLQGLWGAEEPCSSDCSFALLESLPEGLVFEEGSPVLPSISQAWIRLLSQASSSVSIAAFYFTLWASDQGLAQESDLQGQQVFDQLMKLQDRGVKLQIAVNYPQNSPQDTLQLNTTGAEIREVNLQFVTGGIVHTKLWVVDNKHAYVGSANMDWRSLSEVKEVGVSLGNCSCLARDVSRVFGVYWYIGSSKRSSLPPYWPARYSALSSSERPLQLKLNGVPARVYLSSAPPQLSGYGRTGDLSAILSVISDAQKFIFISVMDYLPFSEFTQPPRFWPAIDSALREAACARGVEVNLLVSCWQHSRGSMFVFLESLLVLNRTPLSCNIQVKVFEVSSTEEQLKIPFARVNHAKYMVTDRVAYIGTSNWSENYFTRTAGVGLVVNQTGVEVAKGQETVQSQLQEVFQRDWASRYAQVLSSAHVDRCGKHR